MALPEDLDALCTQQLFRAAESSHLEELDDFDLVLSQTSGAELSALNSSLYSRPRPQSTWSWRENPSQVESLPQRQLLINPQGALQPVRKSQNKSKSKSSKCEDSATPNSCCVQRASRSSGSAIPVWSQSEAKINQ